MSRKANDVKKTLIKATIALLNETQDASSLTVRQIADKAKVNIAMINYYFTSKDELVHQAINFLMEDAAKKWLSIESKDHDPITQLKTMLKQMSDMVIEYYNFTKVSVEYQLLRGDMSVPLYLLPLLKEIFQNSKEEQELRVIAYMLITNAQAILYRSEDFNRYAGLNVFEKRDRDYIVEMMVDNVTKGMGK